MSSQACPSTSGVHVFPKPQLYLSSQYSVYPHNNTIIFRHVTSMSIHTIQTRLSTINHQTYPHATVIDPHVIISIHTRETYLSTCDSDVYMDNTLMSTHHIYPHYITSHEYRGPPYVTPIHIWPSRLSTSIEN